MATFSGTPGDDIFDGGPGGDIAEGFGGNDTLNGNGGEDTLVGGGGADTLDGGDDADKLYSGELTPPFNHPYYNNTYTPPILDAGTDVDTLRGGAGGDRLFAGYGDNVDGGTNGLTGDYLYISFLGAPAGVTVDFRIDTQVVGGGTITGIEHITYVQGSNFGDNIHVGTSYGGGYSDSTALFGLGGDDTLSAGYHTGVLDGGEGNDIVDGRGSQYLQAVLGGAGDDTLYTNSNTFGQAWGGDGNDIIYAHGLIHGGAGNDTIVVGFSYYSEVVYGEEGDDDISASPGSSTIEGGEGADILRGNAGWDILRGGGGADIIYGSLGNDTLEGGAGNDEMTGGSGDDKLYGGDGTDSLNGGADNDTLDGGADADNLVGGGGNDIYLLDGLGDFVLENANEGTDEVRIGVPGYVLPANVENLTYTGPYETNLVANGSHNVVTGGDAREAYYMQHGGDDIVRSFGGNDTFFFGAAFGAADSIEAGAGTDGLILQGNYPALTFGTGTTSNISGIETISLAPGHFTDWGDTTGSFYDYNLTMLNGNVAAGATLKVNGFYLRAGEDFTFNGAAETDGKFILLAGQGVDILTGGNGNDIFAFGPDGRFGSTDVANGGAGYDSVYLRGDYALDFTAASFGTMTSIESITLGSFAEIEYTAGGDGEFDYDLVWDDAMLANDGLITVNGSGLGINETMDFDATDEAGGAFRIFAGAAADAITGGGGGDLIYGGLGADSLRGNGGADTYRYHAAAESKAGAGNHDTILGFTHDVDKIDLAIVDANSAYPGNDAFTFIGAATFSAAGPLSAGQLRTFQSDAATNSWEVHGDTDGDGVADFALVVTVDSLQSLTVSDFLL